jgi:LysM repeat protein
VQHLFVQHLFEYRYRISVTGVKNPAIPLMEDRPMSAASPTSSYTANYTVVVPARLVAPATTTVYIRRRLLVAVIVVTTMLVLWFGAGNVLANRGGAPASTPTVRPVATHVVQPGDTLWSIAESNHGQASLTAYVDTLVEANGGTRLEVGQVISLP